VEPGDLDRKVDPCTDFYEFANGAWRAANPIPASMPRWGRRVAERETNRRQLKDILAELASKRDWTSGSVEQLLGDHYASCMDEASIDAAGLTPLAPLLSAIDGARNLADVQRIVRRLHELAVPVAFGTTGGMDYHEPANFMENVTAGGLGLPNRDYYLKPEPRFAEAREKYRLHVANVLKLRGMPDAQASKSADAVFALEKRLAEASLDSAAAADPAATDHRMTFAQLKELAPRFDWDTYFDEAKLPRVDLNVTEPKFIQQLNRELMETPVATWKAYLTWQLLDSASPWLSRPFVEESFNFKDKYLGGAAEIKPRALRCLESAEALLGDALGKKYVERHFPPAAKAKGQEIVRSLLAVLNEQVVGVQWMGPETKKQALEKLAAYDAQVGYPDKWKDYSTVTIRRDAFWANVAAGRRFNVDDNRKQVGKPTDRGLWQLPPSSPDAYIDFQLNQIVLPAGFLQPPAFSLGATDAVNYGAIGVGVAHDITHTIDTSGAQFDARGRPRKWWTEADLEGFKQRGQCVVDQFEGYFIEPGVHHQGKLVLGESIGDLAGVRLAYLALEKSMQSHPVPVVDGFTPEQQFFISWGQFRGVAERLELQRQMVKEDPHPVSKFRVIGPLSNLPAFHQAFACKAGAEMVRPPEKRCAVW
jgi:endothelin-converting enzyme/putative endopeptidase